MLNQNFIRVYVFILIIFLLFSVSVYDPSVYAKMKVIEDDDLAQIEASTGITIGLNMTVRSVANSISINNGINDSINFGTVSGSSPNVFIGLGTDPTQNVSIVGNFDQDVGTLGGVTYLRQRFTEGIPGVAGSNAGLGIKINDFNANIDGTTRWLGNLQIRGIYMGVNVTSTSTPYGTNVTSALLPGTLGMETWIRPHASHTGIEFWQSQALYIHDLTWTLNSGGSAVVVSGIYMYGANATIPSGDPTGWGALTGVSQIGHNGTSRDWAQIDIGSNGSTNGTILRISMPQYGSMRIKNITLPNNNINSPVPNSSNNFGPNCSDNMQINRLLLTIRNLGVYGGFY
jgi:hypothetical protein